MRVPPLLIILSAPSGGGKSTFCRLLREANQNLFYSISCTTRAPRGQEQDGVQYCFVSVEEFRKRAAAGLFLESAEVHSNLYGTPREPVTAALREGRDVLLDIDVQGAARIRAGLAGDALLSRAFLDIFITPPSLAVLRERLERRGEDSAAVIEKRLAAAAGEIGRWAEYSYVVVNDDLPRAVEDLRCILAAERCRVSRWSRRPGEERDALS